MSSFDKRIVTGLSYCPTRASGPSVFREWSLFTAGGAGGKGGGRKIVVQAVGGGAKIWCTALEGGGKILVHRHLSATSKCLKTIAKIFAAAGAALISLHNITIFPTDFPFS